MNMQVQQRPNKETTHLLILLSRFCYLSRVSAPAYIEFDYESLFR